MTFRSGLIYKQIKQLNFIIKFCKSLLGVSAWFIPTCRGGRQVLGLLLEIPSPLFQPLF